MVQTFIIISNPYFTIPSLRLLFNESCDWWTNCGAVVVLKHTSPPPPPLVHLSKRNSICTSTLSRFKQFISNVMCLKCEIPVHYLFTVWSVRLLSISCFTCAVRVPRFLVSYLKFSMRLKSSSWEDHRYFSLTCYVICVGRYCLHKSRRF